MVDEFKDTLTCAKKIQNHNQMGLVNESVPKFRIPQTSDEESMKNTSNISSDNWPRFLIIEPVSEGTLNSSSPFAIQKTLQGLAGDLKSVKRIRSGRLLVECNKHHSKCLLKSKVMCNIPIKVSAHTSLNSSKGVIRPRDLEGISEDEMLENLFLKECQSSRGFIFVGIMNWFRRIPSF